MKKYILGIITGIIIMYGVTVIAVGLISGSDVSFDNTNTGLTSTDINGALEELYGLYEDNIGECPDGYKCSYIGICSYEVGTEWNFSYSADSQQFLVPCKGLYKLEVWGASGGSVSSYSGGKGGYSVGYIELDSEQNIYVTTGGVGSSGTYGAGGYNGGNRGGAEQNGGYGGAGSGGATHISYVTGVLTNSLVRSNILLVAGGGGGAGRTYNGGNGGGAAGSNGSCNEGSYTGSGATQSSGGAGQGSGGNGSAGKGGGGGVVAAGGAGGGGWYGGGAGWVYCGGGGGAGYIGGVPALLFNNKQYSPSTTVGGNSGNGKARITLVER